MPAIDFIAATEEHAAELARTLRAEDAAELLAQGLGEPGSALRGALACSSLAWAATADGRVAAMFGVRKDSEESASLWFLTGAAFLANARHFIKPARLISQRLAKAFGRLSLSIDSRYAGAVLLAKRLGFQLAPAVEGGPLGVPFHFAELRGA